jgi:hypothetical protein
MDRDTTVYVILAASFSLLFLVTALFLENRKKPIQAFPGKKIPLLMKIPWDTVIKGLAAAGFILFSRKLVYYIPFDGVIQTKFSIWWVEGKAQTLLIISIVVFFMIGIDVQITIWDIKKVGWKEGCLGPLIAMPILVIIGILTVNALSDDLGLQLSITGRHLILIVLAPLLEFKILCSGKYLGLLTSLILGYFAAARYKKLTPGICKIQKIKNIAQSMFLIAGLMFLIFLGFSFYKSLGNIKNWEQRLNKKMLSVTGETEMMDLLDAVNSIDQEKARYETLERIAALIVKKEEFHRKKEIYQRLIEEVKILADSRSSRLLGKIALGIAGTGDITWATAVAEKIPDMKIRTSTLKTIRERIEKK